MVLRSSYNPLTVITAAVRALQVLETTYERGFDSFRAHPLYLFRTQYFLSLAALSVSLVTFGAGYARGEVYVWWQFQFFCGGTRVGGPSDSSLPIVSPITATKPSE